jgi:5-methyltetrahydrofolate--homocysteine methyltransferase
MMRFQRSLEHVEDVILNRRDDATERLLDFAENVKGDVRVLKSSRMAFRNNSGKTDSFLGKRRDEFILWILKKRG